MSPLPEVAVGDELPRLEKEIGALQMFRYSAITWNPHRIHYDREHAQAEGHPGIQIQAHLHGSLLQELLLSWAGPEGKLIELGWQNVGRATGGQTLAIGGEVTAVDESAGTVTVDVWTESSEETCTQGSGTLQFSD